MITYKVISKNVVKLYVHISPRSSLELLYCKYLIGLLKQKYTDCSIRVIHIDFYLCHENM